MPERSSPITNALRFIERLNPYWILAVPFVLVAITVMFLPSEPLKDERFYYPLIRVFGAHYLPSIDTIKTMNQSMGPFYFIFYGLIGKFTDYSLPALRIINVFLSFVAVVVLYKTLARFCKYPLCLTLWFAINPYFLLLTTPLLYTDNLCMLFVLAGTYFYVVKRNLVVSGLLWGLALWTRQTAIIIPLAALLTELYVYRGNLSRQVRNLALTILPFALFFLLVMLWDFNITSPNTVHDVNSISTLGFSLRQLNYAILLAGVYSAPLWLPRFFEIARTPAIFVAGIFSSLLILEFPRVINEDGYLGTWTSGLFDRFLVWLGDVALVLVPVIWIPALAYFILLTISAPKSRVTLFGILCVLFFLCFQAIYSYSWDKYFILVIPFLFLASSSEKTFSDDPITTEQ